MTVSSQAVETAQNASEDFATVADGIFGLAFSIENTVKPSQQKTFFDNIKSSLDEPLFTVDIKHEGGKSCLLDGAVTLRAANLLKIEDQVIPVVLYSAMLCSSGSVLRNIC